MNIILTPEIREITEEAVYFRPAISIIMPFEPKMSSKRELSRSLNLAIDKVERELLQNYPEELVILMMQKLNGIFRNLNFGTHKKSIAVYLTPVFEKVLYLDIQVEQKIMIDESFGIRDVVYSKKQIHKYLVLIPDGKESGMYLGDSNTFVKIISGWPNPAHTCVNGVPEERINFYDISERKKIIMDKFIFHVDKTLDIILNAYHLPLFVLGTEKTVDHFKNFSKHAGAVIEYLYSNCENAAIEQLKEILALQLLDWKKVIQRDLLNQLEEAATKKKLAVGMTAVWREAMNRNGLLLVVEKNFMYAAGHKSIDDIIYKAIEPHSKFSFVKDTVDEVIEKVLENGGDVEFVDEGLDKEYNHIAMVQCS